MLLNKIKNLEIKDIVMLILASGLMVLLSIIVIGDFAIAFEENRPVDEQVIHLLQMSITGIIGILAGYVSGRTGVRKKEDDNP